MNPNENSISHIYNNHLSYLHHQANTDTHSSLNLSRVTNTDIELGTPGSNPSSIPFFTEDINHGGLRAFNDLRFSARNTSNRTHAQQETPIPKLELKQKIARIMTFCAPQSNLLSSLHFEQCTSDSVKKAVSNWFKHTESENPSFLHPLELPKADWSKLAEHKNAYHFVGFLERLYLHTHKNQSHYLTERIRNLLKDTLTSPELSQNILLNTYYNIILSEDKLLLAYYDMQTLLTKHKVCNGYYDGNIKNLILDARDVFRVKKVYTIGRSFMGRDLNTREAGAMLTCICALSSPQEFKKTYKDILPQNLNSLSAPDIEQLMQNIIISENSDFEPWLATWPPLQSFISRSNPELSLKVDKMKKEAIADKITEMQEEFGYDFNVQTAVEANFLSEIETKVALNIMREFYLLDNANIASMIRQ